MRLPQRTLHRAAEHDAEDQGRRGIVELAHQVARKAEAGEEPDVEEAP
jgi:hypothetical protein